MRLFVALEIPETSRRALAELIGELGRACRGPRWSRAEGMHLTLKFIGEVQAPTTEKIRAALFRAAAPSPIRVAFRGVGFFPDDRHPRVFWAGVEAGPELAALAAEIERRLEPLGIPRETREFRPHLTLARLRSSEGVPTLRGALERYGTATLEFGVGELSEFHLIQSQLRPQGAVYTRLETYPFGRGVGKDGPPATGSR